MRQRRSRYKNERSRNTKEKEKEEKEVTRKVERGGQSTAIGSKRSAN